MTASLPASYARGVRQPWASLPPAVRAWVAEQLGEPVVSAEDKVGGFSPGCAAVVRTGTRAAFCKAVGDRPNPVSIELYRRERERLAALPDHPAVPKALAGTDLELPGGRWTVTLLPAVPGEPPGHPWTEPVADLVFDQLGDLGRTFARSVDREPSDLDGSADLVGFFGRWGEVLADSTDPWSAAPWVVTHRERLLDADARVQREVVGTVPAHTDLRADNVLVGRPAPGTGRPEVWFVDWAEARTAGRWVDPALLACDLVVSGADHRQGGTMEVAAFLSTHPTTSGTDPGLHGALMVSLAATLHRFSRSPAQAGLPTIRAWQGRCAETLLGYVQQQDLGRSHALW